MKREQPCTGSRHGVSIPGQPAASARGFTLVELMVVCAILGLLAVIAVPHWKKYRNLAQVKTCVSNLRHLDHAKAQWAFDARKGSDDVPEMSDLTPYLQHNLAPVCPADGTYRLRRVSRFPVCTLYPEGHTLHEGNPDADAAPD